MLVRVMWLMVMAVMGAKAFAASNESPLQQAQRIELQAISAAVESQQRVASSSDKALALQQEIQHLEHELDNQRYYQQHLQALLSNQQQEQASLTIQHQQLEQTRQGIVPLMYRLLSGLEQFIQEDKPLYKESRQHRFRGLQQMMGQADVSDAEKLRQLLIAYQTELEYGSKLGVYRQRVDLEPERELELLHVGRAVLIARSIDKQNYWSWDNATQQWSILKPHQHQPLEQAYAFAAKQVAPSLLYLPVSMTWEERQ